MCFCIILWLPRWRAGTNPCCSKILQISEPERTRSLPNRHLDLGYEYFTLKSPGNLGRRCGFEEERKRLDKFGASLFNRPALTGDIQLRTQCYESVVLAFNDRGHLSGRHASSLRPPSQPKRRNAADWTGQSSAVHAVRLGYSPNCRKSRNSCIPRRNIHPAVMASQLRSRKLIAA